MNVLLVSLGMAQVTVAEAPVESTAIHCILGGPMVDWAELVRDAIKPIRQNKAMRICIVLLNTR